MIIFSKKSEILNSSEVLTEQVFESTEPYQETICDFAKNMIYVAHFLKLKLYEKNKYDGNDIICF